MGRRGLFPRDRALQLRMVLAAVMTPVLTVSSLVAILFLLPPALLLGVLLACAAGIVIVACEQGESPGGAVLAPGEEPRLQAIVDRLCVIADVRRPEIVLETERQPNTWLVDLPGCPPRLHVTRSLLDMLEPDELQAVLAHELSHLANRDALVMTVIGMPGVILSKGGARARLGWWPIQIGALAASLIGLLSRLGCNALSRYREFAADEGASAITGRPSALASALMKVSGRLEGVPRRDLRAFAVRDAFHLLPAHETVASGRIAGSRPVRWLMATHPSLDQRLEALEVLERRGNRAPTIPSD
jgi:heat shock protein HtpX